MYFSELKPNLTKYEIVGIRALKGVQVVVCGMRCGDLHNGMLKILGTNNKKLKEEKNYKPVTDIERVLKVWKMRKLILKGKTVIFKTIAISKTVFQPFIITVPKHLLNEFEKIDKTFLWNNSTSKINHETLCNDYKAKN